MAHTAISAAKAAMSARSVVALRDWVRGMANLSVR